LVISSSNWEANPVMFPPGRARLCTNPEAIGSASMTKTMGIVLVARRAARIAAVPDRTMTSLDLDELGDEGRKPIGVPFSPAVFDHHGLALDPAQLTQTSTVRL